MTNSATMVLSTSTSNAATNSNNSNSDQHFYRLRINVNGFKLDDIKVELVANAGQRKTSVKVTAKRESSLKNTDKDKHDESREFFKLFEIVSKYNQSEDNFESLVQPSTMRYYVDKQDPLYLVVEFKTSAAVSEDVYVTLDDSVDNLMEIAARSLLNVRDLDDLKYTLQSPTISTRTTYTNLAGDEEVDEQTASIIRDLNSAALNKFTPMKMVDGKYVRMNIGVPQLVKTCELLFKSGSVAANVEMPANHLIIRVDGIRVSLEASTSKENVSSYFSKQLSFPAGTDTSKLMFELDESKHSLMIQAPFSI